MAPQLLPASRRARLILGALVAVLAVIIAFGAGYFGPRLTAPGDDSVEAGFARDMSQHHAQAVEMAMYAFRISTDPEIQVIGYDIATSQQYQIGQMQTWLEDWHLSPNRSGPAMAWMGDGEGALESDGRMPGMATNEEITRLKGLTGKDFDTLFCQLMLRHHLGGIHMAEEATKLTHNAQIRDLADAMITTQRKEVTTLTELLHNLGAKPLS